MNSQPRPRNSTWFGGEQFHRFWMEKSLVLPQDIESHLKPFLPFRITTTDGKTYDVRHPELIMIGLGSIIVGIPPTPDRSVFERTVRISLFQIVKIEPLEPAQAEG